MTPSWLKDGDRAGLLVIDVQNDFCWGGALPVPNAERVVSALNQYIDDAVSHDVTVYASRDWHPAVTTHFKSHGGLWPPHCVQGTEGARFHPNLRLPASAFVMTKGDDPASDGYSALDGRSPDGKSFLAHLQERGIRHLYIGGLATDYCVRRSALDAIDAGLQVTVLGDAIAGIDPEQSRRAIVEMRESGAEVVAGARDSPDSAHDLERRASD